MALNGLICADVPLRNYSLTHSHEQYKTAITHAPRVQTPGAYTQRNSGVVAQTHLHSGRRRFCTPLSSLFLGTQVVFPTTLCLLPFTQWPNWLRATVKCCHSVRKQGRTNHRFMLVSESCRHSWKWEGWFCCKRWLFSHCYCTKISSFWTTTMHNKADIWEMAKIVEQLYWQ